MKIGVISDTHGHLDPLVQNVFSGVDHILHAGDIGPHAIIVELEHIAPVTAVLGNTDFGGTVRETEIVVLDGLKFLVNHIVDPHSLEPMLRQRIDRHATDVIIFGQPHKPFDNTIGGIRFFNPGYSGAPRSNVPRSVAVLHCNDGRIRAKRFDLDQPITRR